MTSLPEKIRQNILERRLLAPGQRLLLAVSGGVDSMVLLRLLHGLAAEFGWKLTVAHFNHKLRGRSSDADEALVRRAAGRLRLPVLIGRSSVKPYARRHGLSIEMAARQLRHEFLARSARRSGASTVALAHHADDQVELFFLRLLRGSGSEGLAGMGWRGPSPADPQITLVRPLLDAGKASLESYARQEGVRFRQDASNQSPEFARNRVRHQLLPLLRKHHQPGLEKVILRVMDILGAESNLITTEAAAWLRDPAGRTFAELPVALQRRCLQLQLLEQGWTPDFDLVERLRLNPETAVSLPEAPEERNRKGGQERQGFALRSTDGRVRVRSAVDLEFQPDSLQLQLHGRQGKAALSGLEVRWQVLPATGIELKQARVVQGLERFDAEQVGLTITLRHWRPGDRFQPIGMKQSVKLQDLFINQKVPREQRRRLVLAVSEGGEIFWVEGLRISERFKLTTSTKRGLLWRWKRP